MPRNYRIVSADGHTLEPPDMWERYLPSELHKEHLPRVTKDEEGGDAWQVPGSEYKAVIGLTATGGQRYEEYRWAGLTYAHMKPGAYDGKARLVEQDEDGVDAEILFPTSSPRTVAYFANHADPAVHEAGIEAYNTWQLEEFAAADPDRLIAQAMIPQLGIDKAVEAVHRAKGAAFGVSTCRPTRRAGPSCPETTIRSSPPARNLSFRSTCTTASPPRSATCLLKPARPERPGPWPIAPGWWRWAGPWASTRASRPNGSIPGCSIDSRS